MSDPNSISESNVMPKLADKIADAASSHWVYRSPQVIRPYLQLMRMDRPVGWVLLLLPCWQGLVLSAGLTGWQWHDLGLGLLFAIGAIAMRGAGCTLNDIVDRDLDAQVSRTKGRPIPSGRVSVFQAIVFMLLLCVVGGVVWLALNPLAKLLSVLGVGLAVLYPFMKRVTNWPQFFLGLAFNWGALVGFAAQQGALTWPVFFLYLGGICWTIGYDTIYAHMDTQDDLKAGVKSTALLFGAQSRQIIAAFYGVAWFCAVLAGSTLNVFFVLFALPYAGHFAWQIWRLDPRNPAICLKIFKSNQVAGCLLLLGFFVVSLV